jgi:hypothetical protein
MIPYKVYLASKNLHLTLQPDGSYKDNNGHTHPASIVYERFLKPSNEEQESCLLKPSDPLEKVDLSNEGQENCLLKGNEAAKQQRQE